MRLAPRPLVTPLRLSEIGAHGRDRILCGYNQHNRRFHLDRTNPAAPHVQVSGATGGGKGGFVKILLAHDITVGSEVILLVPKPGEFGWTDGAATQAKTPDGMLRALAYARNTMIRRQAELDTYHDPATGITGLANINLLPNPPHRVIVYIDEARSIIGDQASLEKDERNQARSDIADIAEKGRSAGVHLVMITQNPLADIYGDGAAGGTIRRNLQARIHFDSDADALTMVFKGGKKIPDDALTYARIGTPGRGIYVHFDRADLGVPQACQVWDLPDTAAVKLARRYQGPPPHNFDNPPATRREFHP